MARPQGNREVPAGTVRRGGNRRWGARYFRQPWREILIPTILLPCCTALLTESRECQKPVSWPQRPLAESTGAIGPRTLRTASAHGRSTSSSPLVASLLGNHDLTFNFVGVMRRLALQAETRPAAQIETLCAVGGIDADALHQAMALRTRGLHWHWTRAAGRTSWRARRRRLATCPA